jgi:hypothetical protein
MDHPGHNAEHNPTATQGQIRGAFGIGLVETPAKGLDLDEGDASRDVMLASGPSLQ